MYCKHEKGAQIFKEITQGMEAIPEILYETMP